LEAEEVFDVPEGFLDQGIEKGRSHVACLNCAKSKLEKIEIKAAHVNLMVNWEIEEMQKICKNMKNSIIDYENWEMKITKFDGTLATFRQLLTEGTKYDTTRMFQNVRKTVEEAEKAQVLIQEVFEAKTRPVISRDDLSSFCAKIEQFPFKLQKTDLLREELEKGAVF